MANSEESVIKLLKAEIAEEEQKIQKYTAARDILIDLTDEVPRQTRRGRPPNSKNRTIKQRQEDERRKEEERIQRMKDREAGLRRGPGRPLGSTNKKKAAVTSTPVPAPEPAPNAADDSVDITPAATSPLTNESMAPAPNPMQEAMDDAALVSELAKDEATSDLAAAILPDVMKEMQVAAQSLTPSTGGLGGIRPARAVVDEANRTPYSEGEE